MQYQTKPKPKLLGAKEFAQSIGLSVWTIRQWAYTGRIASAKLGSRLMIPSDELDRLIEENLRPAISRVEEPEAARSRQLRRQPPLATAIPVAPMGQKEENQP